MAAICIPPCHQQGSEEETAGTRDGAEGYQTVREDSGATVQRQEGRRAQARRQGLRQVPCSRVCHPLRGAHHRACLPAIIVCAPPRHRLRADEAVVQAIRAPQPQTVFECRAGRSLSGRDQITVIRPGSVRYGADLRFVAFDSGPFHSFPPTRRIHCKSRLIASSHLPSGVPAFLSSLICFTGFQQLHLRRAYCSRTFRFVLTLLRERHSFSPAARLR